MGITRTSIELVLLGQYDEAGLLPASLLPTTLADIADGIRDECEAGLISSPYAIAQALRLTVVDARLPQGVDVCVGERHILVRDEIDMREHGLLVAKGVSRSKLADIVGIHTESDAILLAAELVAPSGLIVRRGVQYALERQHWIPGWFIRAWGTSLLNPPSSASRLA